MKAREAVRASLRLLNRRDRRLLGLAVLIQMATSFLDLVGVALIGLAGALSVTAVSGQPPPRAVAAVAEFLGLGGLSEGTVVGIFAAAAVVLLLAKSAVAPILMARIFRFLSRREALVASRLTKEVLSRPLTFVQSRSTQEWGFALNRGVGLAITFVLGQMVVGVGEIALLLAISVSLLLINPLIAVGAIAFFGVVFVGLQRALGNNSARLGAERTRLDITSNRTMQEALGAYREIFVGDRRSFYVDRLQSQREEATRVGSAAQLIAILPRYLSEAALVLGSAALAAALFTTQSLSAAAGTFTLFLAAGTRVLPSLLRLQNAALSIRSSAGSAAPTYALAEDLGHLEDDRGGPAGMSRLSPRGYPDFAPVINLRNVTFTYPGAPSPSIGKVSLGISAGQSVAFVGRTGAGKSTLADLLLGVLHPDSGEVTVSAVPPAEAIHRWPGAIAYVPQEVMLVNESVRANVALGLPEELIDDDWVWEALRRAQLEDFLRGTPDGLNTMIGERGLRLSGGQRQRLGIARALYTRPRLLVLDEATSALDAETEQAITAMLEGLDEDVTTVIIAHRLSTIRHADLVVYLEDGEALATGTFDEVCAAVPSLRRQAELMGLRGV